MSERKTSMKMVIVIVSEKDADALVDCLVERDYPATEISSSGGFLRQGNSTILVVVDASEVRDVTTLVRHRCPSERTVLIPPKSRRGSGTAPEPLEVRVGGATMFVLDVEDFEQT